MRLIQFIICFSTTLVISQFALADHPTEGKVAISELITEAQKNNLEIKQIEETLNSLRSESKSNKGRFSPKLSIEGGPQSSKFDLEKSNDSSIYGKVDWNIYNGGYDQSQLAFSKAEIEIQERRLLSFKNKIKNEVSKIYFELQFILESVSLKQKALELNSQQMKIAQAKKKSGLTTSSDVLEFDLRDSTLKSDLVLLQQKLEQKFGELNVLLSRRNHDPQEAVKGHLIRESFNFNRETLLEKIQNGNDQLLLAKLQLRQVESEKRQVKSLLLPKLDIEARYGKLANDEKVFNENNNYSVALKMNIPLFSGLEDYHLLKSANAKTAANEIAVDQKRILLTAELDSTLAEIKALNSRLDLEEKNIERSEEYYKLTLDEYRRGIKNSLDMVGSTERLLEARIRNLEYRRDLMLAQAKIQELSGE